MSKTVIAVVGPDHGGSTMLGAMLASHAQWRKHPHLGEFHALFNPAARVAATRRCVQNELPCPIWRDFPTDSRTPHHEFMARYGVDRLLDSSKNPAWFDAIPKDVELRVVYVWRDPESIRRSFRHRFSPLEAEVKYATQVTKIQSDLDWLARRKKAFVGVSLESLLRAPADKLRQLCEPLDLEYFPGKEEFWRFEHHHLAGARRVRDAFSDPAAARLLPPSSDAESPIQAELKALVTRHAAVVI